MFIIRFFLLSIYMLSCTAEIKAMDWLKSWFTTKKTQEKQKKEKELFHFKEMQEEIEKNEKTDKTSEKLLLESAVIEEFKEDEPEKTQKDSEPKKRHKELPKLPEKIAEKRLIHALATLTEKLSTLSATLSE